MAIVVFEHASFNRPGRLGTIFRDHAFKLDIRRPAKGEPVPVDLDDVDGVIVLGGPQQADEKHAWLEREFEFIRAAHERSLPVIGSCLGHQIVAVALGGTVGPMDRAEAGYVSIELLPVAHTDTILSGIPWTSMQFSSHSYEVKDLPPGAVTLAKSAHCPIQAYRVGMRTYAFQYHFEATEQMIEEMVTGKENLLHAAGHTTAEFNEQHAKHHDAFARLGDRLCTNLATYLVPRVATAVRV